MTWNSFPLLSACVLATFCLSGCGEWDDDDNPPAPTPDTAVGMVVLAIQNPEFTKPRPDGTLCEQTVRTVNILPRPAIAFAYAIFGYAEDCLKSYTSSNRDRRHNLRVYAIDESCRDGDCSWQPGRLWRDVSAEELEDRFLTGEKIEDSYARHADVHSMLARVTNQNTDVTVVLFLEHTLSDEAALRAMAYAQASFPGYRIELNSVHTWSLVSHESHGKGSICAGAVTVVSQDGAYFTAPETEEFVMNSLNCREVYVWPYEIQGIDLIDGVLTKQPGPLPNRIFSFIHEREYSDLFSKLD